MKAASAGIPLGRVGGVPVVLSWSWLLLAGGLLLLFGPSLAEQIGPAAGYGLALGYCLVLLLSVFLHELAHALVGNALGHRSELIALTFLGGHTNLAGPKTGAPLNRHLLAIALSGPLLNLVLAAVTGGVLRFVETTSPADPTGPLGLALTHLLWLFFWANLLLGLFNLLPGLPLDGGQLIEAAVWKMTGRRRRGTAAAAWAGIAIGCAIVSGAVVLLLMRSELSIVLGTALTGGYIIMGAYSQLQRIPLLEFVDSWDVFERMRPVVGRVDASDPAPGWIPGPVLVRSGRQIVGYLEPRDLQAAAAAGQTAGETAGDSMRIFGSTVNRTDSTAAVVQAMSAPETWALAVMEDGRCVGVLTREDIDITPADMDRHQDASRRQPIHHEKDS